MVSNGVVHPKESIECRIEFGGALGTVRYIGNLPDRPGKWYGIEWDDPTRGKHNGTVNDVKFFETKYPTSGSFVKGPKINFGHPLVDTIISKYGKEQSDLEKKIYEQKIMNWQKAAKVPFVEFVGFDKVSRKQSDFESLKIVSVRSTNVSSIGNPDDLKKLFPNITQLDLSKNLLTSWEDIFKICAQLNQLHLLNVSENILAFPDKSFEYLFYNITIFICGNMNLTWPDIKRLSQIFPNIKELWANNNNITNLSTKMGDNFGNLKLLDLENNPIKSWHEIMKLGNLRSLEELSISGIGLEKIDFKTDKPKVDCFPNLTKLSISNNLINDWMSVSELNRLLNLEELRFLNNPILSSEERDTSIAMVIARIGNLRVHNGRILTGEFRVGTEFRRFCEYDYLKKYGLKWLQVKDTPERAAFLKEHNRFLELIQLYGELELDELKVEDTSTLDRTLINLNIVCKDKIVTKRVSPTMVVQKLKILVQKLNKFDEVPQLICRNENNFEIPLDDETKELDFFSVKDNDTIVVKM